MKKLRWADMYDEEEEMAEGLEEEEVDWGSDVDSEPEIIFLAEPALGRVCLMNRVEVERRFEVEDLEEDMHFTVEPMEEKSRGTVEPMEVESSLDLESLDQENLKKKMKETEAEIKDLTEQLKMGGNPDVKEDLEEMVTKVEVEQEQQQEAEKVEEEAVEVHAPSFAHYEQPRLKKKNTGKKKRGVRGKGSAMRRTERLRQMFKEAPSFAQYKQPRLKKKNKGKKKRGVRGKGSAMRRTERRREMFKEVRFFFRD